MRCAASAARRAMRMTCSSMGSDLSAALIAPCSWQAGEVHGCNGATLPDRAFGARLCFLRARAPLSCASRGLRRADQRALCSRTISAGRPPEPPTLGGVKASAVMSRMMPPQIIPRKSRSIESNDPANHRFPVTGPAKMSPLPSLCALIRFHSEGAPDVRSAVTARRGAIATCPPTRRPAADDAAADPPDELPWSWTPGWRGRRRGRG